MLLLWKTPPPFLVEKFPIFLVCFILSTMKMRIFGRSKSCNSFKSHLNFTLKLFLSIVLDALFIGLSYRNNPEILLLPSLKTYKCAPPAFPKSILKYEMTSDEEGLDICGGYNSDYTNECFRLPFKSNTWSKSTTLFFFYKNQ